MKPVVTMLVLLFVTLCSCNNDAAEKPATDTLQNNLPDPGAIYGGDTVPSPQTQADTANSTPKR